MNARLLLSLLFALFVSNASAQSKISFFFNAGYTFNDSIVLKEVVIEQSKGLVFDAGLSFRLFQYKKIATTIGLSGKTIIASGQIQKESFSATTFRLTFPFQLSYQLDNKIRLLGGLTFQNNVDATDFDFWLRDKYSWRMNGVLEANYFIKGNWNLTFGFSQNLRKIPDPYFINDPKTLIFIGLRKDLKFRKNKK